MTFLQRTVSVPFVPAPLARSAADYAWARSIPFFAFHLLPLGAIFTGVRASDVLLCVALYAGRMFVVTGAYHRYFSHRTYKTSRAFQFVLAFLAQTSAQKGALWWAAQHRAHHKHSDQTGDPHDSRRGFWYSHVGWILDRTDATDYSKVRDFAKFPELVFLNVFFLLPAIALGAAVYWFGGWSAFFTGFALSTVLLWHGTFTINSLSHMLGRQRYVTGDDSRNNWLLALVTLGEGWHNNHHYFMGSTRQGFFWWEIDITYYGLKLLSWPGLIWDLKAPPARAYDSKEWRNLAPAASACPSSEQPALPSPSLRRLDRASAPPLAPGA